VFGHYELGGEALGAVPVEAGGNYIYAINLGVVVTAPSAPTKIGVVVDNDPLNLVFTFSASEKQGYTLGSELGFVLGTSTSVKYGVARLATVGFALNASSLFYVELHRQASSGITFGAGSASKFGKVVETGVFTMAAAISTTTKAGAKISGEVSFGLSITASVLLNGIIGMSINLGLGIASAVKWETKQVSSLQLFMDLDSHYNPGWALRPEISPLELAVENKTEWKISFWSKTLSVQGGMWETREPTSGGWTKAVGVSADWVKDDAA
jgi:hypothetical protein